MNFRKFLKIKLFFILISSLVLFNISKSLFNTDLISSSGAPVAFKILLNFFVEVPSSAKVFNDFTLIVLENMLYMILISSAALTFDKLKNN